MCIENLKRVWSEWTWKGPGFRKLFLAFVDIARHFEHLLDMFDMTGGFRVVYIQSCHSCKTTKIFVKKKIMWDSPVKSAINQMASSDVDWVFLSLISIEYLYHRYEPQSAAWSCCSNLWVPLSVLEQLYKVWTVPCDVAWPGMVTNNKRISQQTLLQRCITWEISLKITRLCSALQRRYP